MALVVSFEDFTPAARYDSVPWTEVRIYESDDPMTDTWALIDTIALTPPDSDPSDPASRSFSTSNGTAADLWYQIVFADAAGDVTEPTAPIQNTPSAVTAYTTVDELFRVLKVRTPTPEQTIAAERVLIAAAGEIDSEIDLADTSSLQGWQRKLCEGVNLDRAADLWRHTESIPGVLGALDEALAAPPLRYSWERYAQRLAPLKDQWGLA